LIIEYEGEKYDYDEDDMDIDQAVKIEKHIGGPMLDWEQGMGTGRAECVRVLGWLILHRGSLDVPIASVQFKYGKLMKAFSAAAEKQAAEQAAAEAEAITRDAAPADPTAAASGHAAASTGRKSARASSPSG
jgi:hypothetical protein